MHGGTKSSLHAYLFMKGRFSIPMLGKFTGRLFPLFSIDGCISIMYDNPVFVKKISGKVGRLDNSENSKRQD